MASSACMHLFGVPTLAHEGRRMALALERRSQLLVLLALKRGWVGRGEVAALLWPELKGRLASSNLRKTLFRLPALAWGHQVLVEGGALRFDGETDVAAFEQALQQGRLADALALREGELLCGFDDDANEAWTSWLGHERERLRAAWRGAALAWLAGEVPGPAAVAVSAQLLQADPLDEAALRLHLGWLQRTGQVAAARQVLQRFVKQLATELGLAPSAQLLALGAALRGDTGTVLPPATAPRAEPVPITLAAGGGPVLDPGFIGRGAELRQIASLLEQDDCRLLCLTGPGGIGKTRLARRALQELGAGFADGTAFVALEDLSAGMTLGDALARALALRTDGSTDALSAAIAALQPGRRLLMLDNFETVLDQAAPLQRLLAACPGLKLLVTTRSRLALAEEWTLPVQGLPCPDAEDLDRIQAFDAVRLFERSARRVQPDFTATTEAAAIADICRQVDGLPLALELAAAWVRLLSCREIAAELHRGTALLQAEEASRPRRHASIEQVFDQSWQQLGEAERDALRRLGVFRGGFTPAAARAVAGVSMPVLAALVDKSLLHKDADRLRLHPLVQQLLRTRIDEATQRATAEAHARYHLQALARLRRAAEFGERDALQQLDADIENHQAAWRFAALHGAAAQGAGPAASAQARWLADAVLTLMSHADQRGLRRQGLALGRWAMDSPAALAQPALRAVLLAACAHLAHRLDQEDEAQRLANEALAVAADAQQHDAEVLALKVLGMSTMRQGRLDEARQHHEHALRLADEARDPDLAATVLGNLALVERRCGHHDEAARLLTLAVHQHRRLGDAARESRSLNNLGALLCDQRDFATASTHFRAALALCERHGLDGSLGMVLGNLCYAALEQGDLASCQRHGQRALDQLGRVGDRAAACSVHHTLALLALQRRDTVAAARELAAAMRDAQAVAQPALQLLGLVVLARLLHAEGDVAAARQVLRYVDEHPATLAPVRTQLEHARGLLPASTVEPPPPPWPATALPALVQRIADEGGDGFAALRDEIDRRAG